MGGGGGGGGATLKKSIPTLKFPKSTKTFFDFYRLLLKLSLFSHKTILSYITNWIGDSQRATILR